MKKTSISHSMFYTLIFTLIVLSTACNGASTTVDTGSSFAPTITPLPSTLPLSFPPFSDYRAAYLGKDGHMHAVTLDGKNDTLGPLFELRGGNNLNFDSAGLSSNGRYLALVSDATYIYDFSSQSKPDTRTTKIQTIEGVYPQWSPSGKYFVASNNAYTGIVIFTAGTSDKRIIPGSDNSEIGNAFSWLDEQHILISTFIGRPAGTTRFESMDVTSGARRILHSFPYPASGIMAPYLSPDRKHILLSTHKQQDQPFTAYCGIIDVATGAYRSLPNIIANTLGGWFTTVAWQPGTSNVMVSVGVDVYNDLDSFIINIDTDSTSHLLKNLYPRAWSPDGRTMIMTTTQDSQIGKGPYDLYAATFDSNLAPTVVTLTRTAMSFPFVGFIKTAQP